MRIALVLLFPFLAACASAYGERIELAQATVRQPRVASASATEIPDFVILVKREGAAVVNISGTRTVRLSSSDIPRTPGDEALFELLRRLQVLPFLEEFETHTLGSGFIITEDGYVLTNAHLVADAVEVAVKLTDMRQFKARVIGSDLQSDVALLKIDATGLPSVRIGNPAKLEVGEWVAAIGSPFGFENSVSAGIVSAKGRFLPKDVYVAFIQTDVAVNPGNSGGPLFNLAGEVVGINSQIYSRTGGFMGLSFAIPIDIAMQIGEQLRIRGRVSRGWLGVRVQELMPELAEAFGLRTVEGALVTAIEPGSPAEGAGLLRGT